MSRQRSASLLQAVWRLCRLKRNSPVARSSFSLGLDSLEIRALWAADLGPLPLLADPAVESPSDSMQWVEPDPATLPVQIDPGENILVDSPDTGAASTDPDPSQIPVVVGPGENIPVNTAESQPTVIDIVAGIVGLLARESSVTEVPAEFSLPGIPVELPEQASTPLAVPLIIARTRQATGTATAGGTDVSDQPIPAASLIDELLALDPQTRNARVQELEETLSRWPTDAKAADEGVTQWLRAVETDFINAPVKKSFELVAPAAGVHADESRSNDFCRFA